MRRLIRNIFSLSILQLITYTVPLVLLPFLVRTLGVDNYGKTIFAQSFCAYFLIITDFGFNLSASREVSLARDNTNKLSIIYSKTIYSKLFLLCISFFIFFLVYIFTDFFKNNLELFLISFLVVVGNAFTPIWLFQGLEKMNELVISNVISKCFLVVFMFLFVTSPGDILRVPFIYGCSSVFLMLVLNTISIYRVKVRFVKVTFFDIKLTIYDSSQYFMSRVANEGLMNSVTFLIGLKFGDIILGYYSMAEKLYRAFYMLLAPINQSLYPYMVKTKNILLFKKIFIGISLIAVFGSLVAIFISPYLYMLLFSIKEYDSIHIFRILCIATIFGVSNSLVGFPLLGALGYIRTANYSLIGGAIISFIYLIFIYILNTDYLYFIYSLIIYESVSLFTRLFFVNYYGVLKRDYNVNLQTS